MVADFTIDVVRGAADAVADELLAFWAATGALDPEAARQRLAQVVCVLRGADGAIAGACSVFAADVPQLGGRRFWVFRSLLPGAAAAQFGALARETFAVLDAEFDDTPEAPVGLCVVGGGLDARFVLAGHVEGRPLHVAYFAGARVYPGERHGYDGTVPAGYRVERFAEQDAVTGDDLVEMWARAGVLGPDEARRRVDEVMLVAIGPDGRPAGAATAYLEHNDTLRLDLFYGRVFVAAGARGFQLSCALALGLRETLVADTRGAGVIFEVESEVLTSYYPQAVWPTGYTYIGENARGIPLWISYFAPQGSA